MQINKTALVSILVLAIVASYGMARANQGIDSAQGTDLPISAGGNTAMIVGGGVVGGAQTPDPITGKYITPGTVYFNQGLQPNVGIGTSTPSQALSIAWGALDFNDFGYVSSYRAPANNFTNLFLGGAIYDGGSGTYTVMGDGGSDYFAAIRMDNGGDNLGAINFYSGPSVGTGNYTITNAQLASYQRMTINNGNVGIGTASPTSPLDVNGTITAGGVWDEGINLTRGTSLAGQPNAIGAFPGWDPNMLYINTYSNAGAQQSFGSGTTISGNLYVNGGIRPGSTIPGAAMPGTTVKIGQTCSGIAEGTFAYDATNHTPVYCNNNGSWGEVGGGITIDQTITFCLNGHQPLDANIACDNPYYDNNGHGEGFGGNNDQGIFVIPVSAFGSGLPSDANYVVTCGPIQTNGNTVNPFYYLGLQTATSFQLHVQNVKTNYDNGPNMWFNCVYHHY